MKNTKEAIKNLSPDLEKKIFEETHGFLPEHLETFYLFSSIIFINNEKKSSVIIQAIADEFDEFAKCQGSVLFKNIQSLSTSLQIYKNEDALTSQMQTILRNNRDRAIEDLGLADLGEFMIDGIIDELNIQNMPMSVITRFNTGTYDKNWVDYRS